MRFSKIWHFILMVLFVCLSSHAATYYVSASGNDQSSGTRLAPWKSLSKANTLTAGDTLRLLKGTFAGTTEIIKSGLPEKPIVLISDAALGDTANYALIDGLGNPSTDSKKHGFVLNKVSWVNIENIKLKNCYLYNFLCYQSSYISMKRCVMYLGTCGVNLMGGHHILIDSCLWEADKRAYTEWDWTEMHHGSLFYAAGQGFFAGHGTGGCVVKNNTIRFPYDGITFLGHNVEIYSNHFDRINDDSFDAEGSWFNWHVYHNTFYQAGRNWFSYMSGFLGYLYVYGNLLTRNEWDTAKGTCEYGNRGMGFFKFSGDTNGTWTRLEYPLYAFHNSLAGSEYTTWGANWYTQHHVHQYNNAFQFAGWDIYQFETSDKADNHLDYDCFTAQITPLMQQAGWETHGIHADPGFVNPEAGDLRLNSNSPCFDKGKMIPNFTQGYAGGAPDIGAYERQADGTFKLVEGPPFKIMVPPEGDLGYVEKPRITRHHVSGNKLSLFFSWDLNTSSVSPSTIKIRCNGKDLGILKTEFPANTKTTFPYTPFELLVTTSENLDPANIQISFDPMPVGTNGETATYWASTVPYRVASSGSGILPEENRMSLLIHGLSHSAPASGHVAIQYECPDFSIAALKVFDLNGKLVKILLHQKQNAGTHSALWDKKDEKGKPVSNGIYLCRLKVAGAEKINKIKVIE